MAENGTKIGFGAEENIPTAIQNGIIDEHDLVVTSGKDYNQFYFVDADKKPHRIKPRTYVYETVDAAVSDLNSSGVKDLAGQQVSIKGADGKYSPYLIQEDTEGRYTVEAISTGSGTGGLTWIEF